MSLALVLRRYPMSSGMATLRVTLSRGTKQQKHVVDMTYTTDIDMRHKVSEWKNNVYGPAWVIENIEVLKKK